MGSHYDAVIIGTGQSGPPLAGRMNAEGMKVAIVERKLIGGTCVNVGCIPTKTLVGSARIAYAARQAAGFGVNIGGQVTVDMKRVKARKDEIVGGSNQGVTRWIEGMDNVELFRGHARFKDAHTIEVNDETLTADKFFIDVGARARVPDWSGLSDVPYLTNSSMMDVDFLPDHLIIIGGSYIGLEFAQIYRRFGCEVTVIEMQDRLIGRDDVDVSLAVQEILEGEGVKFRLNAKCLSVIPRSQGVAVQVTCDEDPKEIEGSHLLLAVGRVPNTDDLGLAEAGVQTDKRGFIPVDDHLHTNVQNIWAIGEVNARGAFTHTSYNDYEIVAANLFDNDPRSVSDRILCYGLFIDPPLGRIGMTEAEAVASGRNILMGKRMMSRVGRAREFGDTRGFMKVLVDADSEEILGAAILGLNGDEAIHSLLDVMYARKPYTVISRAVHIHPTVTELIPTMLQDMSPLRL
ncbi:MAG: FAD-containing oxidoreductase [Gammaproteobacteria bacterium]|nr:FAD-containing oxidoreductase [Gammaproteobacteria bacterium]MDH3767465.1 FAD-containing oxidoreductase [Gammaproteobacteria bacterium]